MRDARRGMPGALAQMARSSHPPAVQKLAGYHPTRHRLIDAFLHMLCWGNLWRESITGALSSTLCGANNECAAGCLDHILCDDMQFVNTQDPL